MGDDEGVFKVSAEVVICPPFVFLSNIQYLTPNIKLGAQDVSWEKEGAYTGEVSLSMLKDTGCQYVIVGHSERRRYFNETDEIINKKLKVVLAAKLNPIFCIGETQEQRNKGETDRILKKQIEKALKDISKFKIQSSKFSIAYEPIWAIGTGKPCDVEEAQKMGLLIRKIISKIYNQAVSKNVRILYFFEKKSSTFTHSQNSHNNWKMRLISRGRITANNNIIKLFWLCFYIIYHLFNHFSD